MENLQNSVQNLQVITEKYAEIGLKVEPAKRPGSYRLIDQKGFKYGFKDEFVYTEDDLRKCFNYIRKCETHTVREKSFWDC